MTEVFTRRNCAEAGSRRMGYSRGAGALTGAGQDGACRSIAQETGDAPDLQHAPGAVVVLLQCTAVGWMQALMASVG